MPEFLRGCDVELQIVADHPCVSGLHLERTQGASINAVVRLAESQFPLDENGIEQVGDLEPRNFSVAEPPLPRW